MKKLDLNIKLRDVEKSEDGKTELKGCEVAVRWIGAMIERALNKPDAKTGRATVNVNMNMQRKYFKVLDALDHADKGVVSMDDDVFDWMDKQFQRGEMPVQSGVTEVLVAIDDAINKAKVKEK